MVDGQQSKFLNMRSSKKNLFCLIFPFDIFDHYTAQKKNLILKIAESFEEFYIINISRLEISRKSKSINIDEIKKKIPKNCKIFDPKSSNEFLDFSKNKQLILLCNIGRTWRYYKIHYLLKKIDAKLIYSHEIGNIQYMNIASVRAFFLQFIAHYIPHKIVIILSILNIFPKIDLRFLTNKNIYNKTTNSFLYKISNKYKFISLFYTKKFELINSMPFDNAKLLRHKITEDKIVMIDTVLNHPDNVLENGVMDKNTFIQCYKILERFLKKISKVYNKPVVICAHPTQDLDEIRKLMKDFEVVKYQTKENIYKSFITFFYNSSAVVDAYILRKRIVGLENSAMGKSVLKTIRYYPSKTGIIKINIDQEFEIKDKKIFLEKIDQTIESEKYKDYINNFLISDGENSGVDKMINIIKERYFK